MAANEVATCTSRLRAIQRPATRRRNRERGENRGDLCRAPSMARPKGTREGHAASQARHWRQNSITSATEASSGTFPAATAAMALSRRPRVMRSRHR